MGTSKPFNGPSGANPLLPSWLDAPPDLVPGDIPPTIPVEIPTIPIPPGRTPPAEPLPGPVPEEEPLEVLRANRYSSSRRRMTGVSKSLATNAPRLRQATSDYVRKGLGGAKRAASRMGGSARAAGRMIGFIRDIQERGFIQAAREFGLGDITGRSPQEIAPLLAEAFLEPSGGIDAGISNRAWVETVVEAIENDIVDINGISADVMIVLLENYITRTIELRLLQDIAAKLLRISESAARAHEIRGEIHQLIRGEVRRAVRPILQTTARVERSKLSSVGVRIYKQTFAYLQQLSTED